MAETEIIAHLRVSPGSLDLLRQAREDLVIIRDAVAESPERKAAFERFLTSFSGSFEKVFEFI